MLLKGKPRNESATNRFSTIAGTFPTTNKFVELRAAGKSFGEIAEELGVVKSTLHRWADERADDIARLRRHQWEDWEAEVTCRIEDRLESMVCRIADYEMRLRQFQLGELSLRDTVLLLRAILMGTAPAARRGPRTDPSTMEPAAPETAVEKSNETERFHEVAPTQQRGTNDLQQLKSESFDFPPPENQTRTPTNRRVRS